MQGATQNICHLGFFATVARSSHHALTRVLDGADGAAQFGKAAQPADRGVTGIGALGLGKIVEHAMAVIRPEHDLITGRTLAERYRILGKNQIVVKGAASGPDPLNQDRSR